MLRDWSLITGRGATKREGRGGGQVKFYHYKKTGGWGGISLAMPKGEHKKF